MSAEWDQLMQNATQQLGAAERERESREHDEQEAAAKLRVRFGAVAKQYAAIVRSFADEVLKHGLPGAENYTFDRHKEPLFRSRFVQVPLVFVPGVARSWYQVGDGGGGPVYSHEQALAVGTEIRPTIMAPFGTTERIGINVYNDARSSTEDVCGLTRMLTEAERYGVQPEIFLPLLKEGIAAWAARHFPELRLDLPQAS